MHSWPAQWPVELRRLVAVIPHPDDEVFAAGLLYRAASAGAEVVLVCATRGERGRLFGRLASTSEVARIRTMELVKSCRNLGIRPPRFLDLPDGGLDANDAAHAQAIERAIDATQPDAVISYGIDGGYGHRDHVAVAEVVGRCRQRWLQIEFPDGLWDQFRSRLKAFDPQLIRSAEQVKLAAGEGTAWELVLGETEVKAKQRTIASHASQLRPNGTFLFSALVDEVLTHELYREMR